MASLYVSGPCDPRFMAGEAALGVPVESPDKAVDVLLSEVPWKEDRESAWSLMLDTKHRLLSVELMSMGAVSNTFMAPRELFRSALLSNAAAFIVAHNHPSGDPEPSSDDCAVTRRLASASKTLGVELLDHLVVGFPSTKAWVSLARRGHV